MNVVCIVQARVGSTRLPGKILKELSGKALLWHVMNRLSFAQSLDQSVLTIPETSENDCLVELAQEWKIDYFRGSETDVLKRYAETARQFNADVIVRVTSDCPLIEPILIDQLVKLFLEKNQQGETVHFAANNLHKSYPHGLDFEIFSRLALEESDRDAVDPHDREHVGQYARKDPERYPQIGITQDEDRSDLRWTVDTQEDFDFVERVYNALYQEGAIFHDIEVYKLSLRAT